MSSQGSSPTIADLLAGVSQSVGSQAQFGLLLQQLQRIGAILENGGNGNPYTVYPFTGSGDLTIATAFPAVTAGTFSIRKVTPAITSVNLPTSGGPWVVADGNGGAVSNNITVVAPGGFTINGASNYTISTNWQVTAFMLDAANYVAAFQTS